MITPELDRFDDWTVDELPVGLAADAGSSKEYLTGGWRAMRPVWDADKCTNCMLCWIVCPDASIMVADGEMTGIDYDHCKGCGVCIHECRFDALKLVREHAEEVA